MKSFFSSRANFKIGGEKVQPLLIDYPRSADAEIFDTALSWMNVR